jgi:hypothetical protein
MSNAAGFVGQFFPIFLLGALFGKLMEASGSVEAIAKYLMERLGTREPCLPSSWRENSSPMAASACLLPSSCWRRWASPCLKLPIYRNV